MDVFRSKWQDPSPFNTAHEQYLISEKIHLEGFELKKLDEWMKPLIVALKEHLERE